MPSKNLIRSALVADLVRHASEYGVCTERAAVDMEGVRQPERELVDRAIELLATAGVLVETTS